MMGFQGLVDTVVLLVAVVHGALVVVVVEVDVVVVVVVVLSVIRTGTGKSAVQDPEEKYYLLFIISLFYSVNSW